jgi:cysteinyl-tRNA synthetase
MSIRIYDSLRRETTALEAREPGRIGMYVCGPTVYNYVHIGNARTALWFDLIRRYLVYRGFEVTYVTNYTDVDDKIIERANAEGLSPDEIATKYADAYEKDMSALGVGHPDELGRATQHIPQMIEAIEGLVERDVAYAAEGNVFFSVERFPGYGQLSGRSLDDMRAGERIEPHAAKRFPLDFALWKAAKPGEPSWPSPWGPGRPGWHIECSVMAVKYLGMGFDIHGGGTDLVFPHHENEIAQAEALHNEGAFAAHWMHAGMVQMEDQKMSKSLGNVALARDVLERFCGDAVRLWAIGGSYRSQVAFSEAALHDADAALDRWRTFLEAARAARGDAPTADRTVHRRPVGEDVGDHYVARFVAAMDEDFNSSEALAVVHELVREGNRRMEVSGVPDTAGDGAELEPILRQFLEITSVLGFRLEPRQPAPELVSELVNLLLRLREEARAEGAFLRADDIRDELARMGIKIEDTAAGPRWRPA